ncbi:MAG: hypothetical protein AMXMBFR66_26710 [Pseudomonadota bacterium]|nr:hypothetical protein [Rubrivivax sp.]NLZ42678.1 hypothetical protein [Comamonadaceae bacterium]
MAAAHRCAPWPRRPGRRLLPVVGLVVLGALAAGTVAAADARAALAQQREQHEAGFAAEESACRRRFAVNACLEAVRQRRREALAPLRERELALAEAERRERAAEHLRALHERQQASTARAPPAAAPVRRARAPAAAASPAGRRSDETPVPQREQQAAERAAAAERRRQDARATQERIERRLRDRAASGQSASPLPASAARR